MRPAPIAKKVPVWLALGDDRPLAAFAGIWRKWPSVQKSKEGEVNADLYTFLTTDANAEIAPIDPKAILVVLTTEEEVDVWERAPREAMRSKYRCLTAGCKL